MRGSPPAGDPLRKSPGLFWLRHYRRVDARLRFGRKMLREIIKDLGSLRTLPETPLAFEIDVRDQVYELLVP